jgi:hypothetical protein
MDGGWQTMLCYSLMTLGTKGYWKKTCTSQGHPSQRGIKEVFSETDKKG